MRQLVQLLAVGLGVVTLAASASAPSAHRVETTAKVQAPFDATWEAVVDTLVEKQWSIAMSDRASGLITTRPMRVDDRYADCGHDALDRGEGTYGTLDVRVKSRGDDTSITVNAIFKEEHFDNNRSRFVACTSRGVVESALHKEMARRATPDE